jgi:uncharacterized protein YndB with AHSA1/START domain
MQAPHDVLFRAWTDEFDRWCAGAGSVMTRGTMLLVELTPLGNGTHLRLTHGGLPDEKAKSQHDQTWPILLADLDRRALARA